MARHFAERFERREIDIIIVTLFVISCLACYLQTSDTCVLRK